MSLLIDYREKALSDALTILTIPYTKTTLLIGDIQINNSWLLERKTINDLHQSILDGRFEEQRNRLRQIARENMMRIGYIIEGLPQSQDLNGGLAAALASLSMEFAVFISDSPTTTALQIKKIMAGQKQNEASIIPQIHKIQVKTPTGLLKALLLSITGVGDVYADAIATHYKSINNFVTSYCDIEQIKTKSGRKCTKALQQKIATLVDVPHDKLSETLPLCADF